MTSPEGFQLSPQRRALFQKEGVPRANGVMLERRSRQRMAPLSFAQERLWFLDQFQADRSVYNIPGNFQLPGALHLPALHAAFNEVVRRHEALRTTFPVIDGKPVQLIAPSARLSLPLRDLRALPVERREAETARLAAEERSRPFDLMRDLPLRVQLLRVADELHLVLLTMHHIVSDARSMEIFFSELSTLYRAYAQGSASPLPEPPVQYADFAEWQRDWLCGEVLDEQLAFWRRQLSGAPQVIGLPTDRPRPPVQRHRGALQAFRLSRRLVEELRALSIAEGATLFMTMLAGFLTLLHRYSGETTLCVGTPIANRDRAELESLIGLFVNTVVLRVDLRGDLSFRALIASVRETALTAYSHQDLPFEKLVEELHPQRSMGHNPLFQVMFTLQSAPAAAVEPVSADPASADREEPLSVTPSTAKFDLNLSLVQCGQDLTGAIEYNTDLFDDATITRMVGHLLMLLTAAAAQPNAQLADLPLLMDAEQQQLARWNASAETCPAVGGIHRLVEDRAARTPAAPALCADGREISYGELNQRADRLARRLRRLGCGPDMAVGIFGDRSIETFIGLLGVLKAGGASLPLDPTYPAQRLAFMLADSGAPLLVTQKRLVANLPPHQAFVVCVDEDEDEDAAASDEAAAGPTPALDGDRLAYIIYTSGSTGRPKGAAVTHRTLLNLILWQMVRSRCPEGRTLQYAPLSFDVALQEIFATWCAGGCLVLIDETDRCDMRRLPRLLREAAIERLFLPYVALKQLAESVDQDDLLPSELREVITAGEQLRITPAIRRFFARLPQCTLANQYGPSETHVVSEFVLPPAPASWPVLPPIGRPIAATQLHVLDDRLRPVPIGVPGELYVGGVPPARGYLGRPAATAESFVPNPWAAPGTRLYRTGDLARYLPDGNLEFLGRRDDQLKIRGHRIEPGEVEVALSQAPGVRAATVACRTDPAGELSLVGYLVAEGEPSIEEIRGHLRRSLPEYMVPSSFIQLPYLPMTPSGKVDRRALVALDGTRLGIERPFAAPRTSLEQRLAEIWRGVLGVERIGVSDNFFDLGGHSLSATRVVARIRDLFDIEVPLVRIFEQPSIAGLACALIEAELARDESPEMVTEVEALSDEEAAVLSREEWTIPATER